MRLNAKRSNALITFWLHWFRNKRTAGLPWPPILPDRASPTKVVIWRPQFWSRTMKSGFSRREFLAGLGAVAAGPLFTPRLIATVLTKSPFRIAVINDEISQDFGHACEVASGFGMRWIELRGMWDKNIIDL